MNFQFNLIAYVISILYIFSILFCKTDEP